MKKLPIIVALVLTLSLAGCVRYTQGTQSQEMQATEENQKGLREKYPVAKLEHSLELENLNRRLEFVNQPDRVSYIYLLDHGKVITFFPIKGKVSSLNSFSTTSEQLVDSRGRLCGSIEPKTGYVVDGPCYDVESPDLDGSYGDNGEGVFFFTTDGVYVEWKGNYMLASEPLKISTPPELVREVK
jgi:hypothetical protein